MLYFKIYFDEFINEWFTCTYLKGNFAVCLDKYGERMFLNGNHVRWQIEKTETKKRTYLQSILNPINDEN